MTSGWWEHVSFGQPDSSDSADDDHPVAAAINGQFASRTSGE